VRLDIAHLQGEGRRRYQQDYFALSDTSPAALDAGVFDFVLADGMGGALDGGLIARETVTLLCDCLAGAEETAELSLKPSSDRVAAKIPAADAASVNTMSEPAADAVPAPEPAADAAPARFTSAGATPEQLLAAIRSANARIYERYHETGGTTLIVARIINDALWFASVGDSTLYLRRAGRLFELNRRHTFLLDLYERVLDGLLSVDDAQGNAQAKALSSFIGSGALRLDYSRRPLALLPGDVLLACSDGLSDTLTATQILEATASEVPSRQAGVALRDMIEAAGLPGQDNYTAIIVRYG
jgi:serine/threonine protein phosphatase PrpC